MNAGCRLVRPRCRLPNSQHPPGLYPLPSIVCICGYNRVSGAFRETIPSVYKNLLNVSGDALNTSCFNWDREAARRYIKPALLASGHSYRSALSAAFGTVEDAHDWFLRANVVGPDKEPCVVKFAGTFPWASAPECCAILAALNIDFRTAMQGFLSVPTTSGTVPKRSAEAPPDHAGIRSAKHRAVDATRRNTQFSRVARATLPTINDDRMAVLHVLSDPFLTPRKLSV